MTAAGEFDLLVVGGGINGAGIARDAAGRNLRVELVEQGDFGGATSSASTKLIHGGLRYLEHYEFRLVSEALAEREVLLRIASHIARPLRFVMPHVRGLRPAWMIRAGLLLYDRIRLSDILAADIADIDTDASGAVVMRLGEPLPAADGSGVDRLFPSAAAIAGANLEGIGMPGKRVQTLQHFAGLVASGALHLDLRHGSEALIERLCALPGIGPWTAEYIALRAFGAADAFPASDLGLLKAPLWGADGIDTRQLKARAEAWRPWRAYAAAHLWHNYSQR